MLCLELVTAPPESRNAENSLKPSRDIFKSSITGRTLKL